MTVSERRSHDQRGHLYLTFRLGADLYAIDAHEIVEVLPLLPLKALPEAPAWIAGILSHRGQLVPVVDLTARAHGRPAAPKASTRLVLVRYPLSGGETRTLGLVLERASQTTRLDDDGFAACGIDRGSADYLGPVRHDGGMLQRIAVAGLLPDDVRALLFPRHDGGS